MSQNHNVLGAFDDLLMNFTRLATQLLRDMLVKLGIILMKKTMITSTLMTLFTSLLVTPSFASDSFDYSQHNFTVKSGNMSLKYRDHSRLDNWMTQFDVKIGAFKAYAKIQPKFAIDRDGYDDGEYYEAQNNYGVDYKVSDKLSVGVYLEQNTDDDWNVKSEFIATKVSCKF